MVAVVIAVVESVAVVTVVVTVVVIMTTSMLEHIIVTRKGFIATRYYTCERTLSSVAANMSFQVLQPTKLSSTVFVVADMFPF